MNFWNFFITSSDEHKIPLRLNSLIGEIIHNNNLKIKLRDQIHLFTSLVKANTVH